jgi:hypothetical protein
MILSVLMLTFLTGCLSTGALIGTAGGTATIGGVIYWLMNQNWMAKICYWVGDEAALKVMPVASKNVDADVIAFCAECIAYCESANNLDAATVNAELAAAISTLPPAQVAAIQEAAKFLDEFLPPATSTAVLTSAELNDIIGFLKGWKEGTTVCMNNLPADVQKALSKATNERTKLRAKHAAKMKAEASQSGGWFCQVK